jgi:hypothetical protein
MKKNDLQPWLDYFKLLQRYESEGYLEVYPEKHEAYVTQPAIFALTPGDDPNQQLLSGAIPETVSGIRTYAAWRSQQGMEYLDRPFALNIVKDTPPHAILCIIVLDRRRSWRHLWRKADGIEVIDYSRNVDMSK